MKLFSLNSYLSEEDYSLSSFWLAGSSFPDQGSHPHTLQWKFTREVPGRHSEFLGSRWESEGGTESARHRQTRVQSGPPSAQGAGSQGWCTKPVLGQSRSHKSLGFFIDKMTKWDEKLFEASPSKHTLGFYRRGKEKAEQGKGGSEVFRTLKKRVSLKCPDSLWLLLPH